ncbi:MAG: hypothetical protein IKZ28_06635 [Clostridia bacterium]|nr:hypothetical protein [Clostridia bacterium]
MSKKLPYKEPPIIKTEGSFLLEKKVVRKIEEKRRKMANIPSLALINS